MTTLKDISTELGLSVATRSRALNSVLELNAPRAAAMVCGATLITVGMLQAARDLSPSVPRNLSDRTQDDALPDLHASGLQTLARADLILPNSSAPVPLARFPWKEYPHGP